MIKNSFGVCSSNYINNLIDFHSMLIHSGAEYTFIIMNTDRADKKGTHWWSFLDLHPKKEIFLFDSFEISEFKEFIVQDNKKILNKILFSNKVTLITLKLSIHKYGKMKNFNMLSPTIINILHLVKEYAKKHKLKNKLIVHLVNEMIEKDTFGMYQLYFFYVHVLFFL